MIGNRYEMPRPDSRAALAALETRLVDRMASLEVRIVDRMASLETRMMVRNITVVGVIAGLLFAALRYLPPAA